MNFVMGELFCGPGGMALGAALAKKQKNPETGEIFSLSHSWGVDRDPAAIATYNANLGKAGRGAEGICCNAENFCRDYPDQAKNINALAFGFPCNDFSLVGEKNGLHGSFGKLYKAGIKVINASNPEWFIAENVSGISSANKGAAFKKILRELKAAGKGYVITPHLYRFEEYGVPQMRHRYLIVGIRNDLNLTFKPPAPVIKEAKNFTSVEAYFQKAETFYKAHPDKVPLNDKEPVQTVRVKERLRFIPPWENAWYLDTLLAMSDGDLVKTLKKKIPWFESEIKPLGSAQKIRAKLLDVKLNVKKARMSQIYKRLHPQKPAYTITGSGGGGTHVYHWSEHRALTNRERARIQTFPEDFEFKGTNEEVRKQIGMAVPVEGAKIIFEAILKTFAGIGYVAADQNCNIDTMDDCAQKELF
jgi:DNA (cytosine-5)-methyltransferase 1